jgi:hypothetical protein
MVYLTLSYARSGREMKRKYENGMHSFNGVQDAGDVASSGFDGCSVHSLSECYQSCMT